MHLHTCPLPIGNTKNIENSHVAFECVYGHSVFRVYYWYINWKMHFSNFNQPTHRQHTASRVPNISLSLLPNFKRCVKFGKEKNVIYIMREWIQYTRIRGGNKWEKEPMKNKGWRGETDDLTFMFNVTTTINGNLLK